MLIPKHRFWIYVNKYNRTILIISIKFMTLIFDIVHILFLDDDVPHATSYSYSYSLQIFNAARQLSHIEAAPDKSGLVLLDYWFCLKRCLIIIHN